MRSSAKPLTLCLDDAAVLVCRVHSLIFFSGNSGGVASGGRNFLADFRVKCQGVDFRLRISVADESKYLTLVRPLQ